MQPLSELVSDSDYKVVIQPGTSFEDAFKFSTDPDWQDAWKLRIQPELDTYSKSAEENVAKIIAEPGYAFYNNFFAIRCTKIFKFGINFE